MLKVTSTIGNAFNANGRTGQGNTVVTTNNGRTEMVLHGHLIAYKENGKLFITNCGYATNVTKDRLNSIEGVRISQTNFEWFLNGVKWDGKLIEVK
jgi:hypothetical protein